MYAPKALMAAILGGVVILASSGAWADDAKSNAEKGTAGVRCDAARGEVYHPQTNVTTVILRGAASEQNTFTIPAGMRPADQNCTR